MMLTTRSKCLHDDIAYLQMQLLYESNRAIDSKIQACDSVAPMPKRGVDGASLAKELSARRHMHSSRYRIGCAVTDDTYDILSD